MTISLNKISNFFKVRKLKRKVKQLRKEVEELDEYQINSDHLSAKQIISFNRMINYIELDILILEQQIKELE